MKTLKIILTATAAFLGSVVLAQSNVQEVYYENGQLHMAQEMQDGVEHGKFVLYYPSGEIKEQGQYAEGKKTGEWKRWNENGQQVALATYNGGKKHGDWKIWDDAGVLRYDLSYANDAKVDIAYMYDENGNILSQKSHD